MASKLLSAEAKAARAYAQAAPDGWLACRTRRRHWLLPPTELGNSDKVSLRYDPKEHIYQMEYVCLDCGGTGEQQVDSRTGFLKSKIKFTPPEGYKFLGGEGYPMSQEGIGQCRLEQFTRGLERQAGRSRPAAAKFKGLDT